MLFFILGFLAGMTFSILVVLTIVFLKHKVERITTVIEKQVSSKGPRPKGFIVEPESDGQRARQAIIDHNQRMGRSTPISDLR